MMSKLKKNKKGIEASGFSVIIGIIILLVSTVVILGVITASAKMIGGKFQVELCRWSNQMVENSERNLAPLINLRLPNLFCSTIDEDTVPTKKYKKDYEDDKIAAEHEVGDMIKNCWYMWLEGSKEGVFPPLLGTLNRDRCFTCYTFKIDNNLIGDTRCGLKDNIVRECFNFAQDRCTTEVGCEWIGVSGQIYTPPYPCEGEIKKCDTYTKEECDSQPGCELQGDPGVFNAGELKTSMDNRVYEADASDNCAKYNLGGFFKDECEEDEKEAKGGRPAPANEKCCIKKNNADICGNKGGKCFIPNDEGKSSDPNGEYTFEYNWKCIKTKEKCYLKDEDYDTYLDYVMTYGGRGGGLAFNGGTTEDIIDFEDTLAITFHSYTSLASKTPKELGGYGLWLEVEGGKTPTYIMVSSSDFATEKCDTK